MEFDDAIHIGVGELIELNRDSLATKQRPAGGSVEICTWRLSDALRFLELHPQFVDVVFQHAAKLRGQLAVAQ